MTDFTIQDAHAILKERIMMDGSIADPRSMMQVHWSLGQSIRMDGLFSPIELEAIALWVRHIEKTRSYEEMKP